MFDTNKIGQSFSPFTIEVARCKIHELALAIGTGAIIAHGMLIDDRFDWPFGLRLVCTESPYDIHVT
jgi:hypothetical protein